MKDASLERMTVYRTKRTRLLRKIKHLSTEILKSTNDVTHLSNDISKPLRFRFDLSTASNHFQQKHCTSSKIGNGTSTAVISRKRITSTDAVERSCGGNSVQAATDAGVVSDEKAAASAGDGGTRGPQASRSRAAHRSKNSHLVHF